MRFDNLKINRIKGKEDGIIEELRLNIDLAAEKNGEILVHVRAKS
jgi:hypothetical protein